MWSGDGGCDDASLRADWNAWLSQIGPHVTPDPVRDRVQARRIHRRGRQQVIRRP
jgi:hypothetical protein